MIAPRYIRLLVGSFLVVGSPFVTAALFAFEFTGLSRNVRLNENDVLTGFGGSQPVSGSFCFGNSPNIGSTTTGFYEQNADLTLLAGSTELSFLGAPINMRVGNDVRRGGWDSYEYWINETVGEWEFEVFGLFLEDSTATALSSIGVPSALNLEDYDSHYFEFRGRHIPSDSMVDMTIHLTSITSVPEPNIGYCLILVGTFYLTKRKGRTSRAS